MLEIHTLIRDLHAELDRPEELRIHVSDPGTGIRITVQGFDGSRQVFEQDIDVDETPTIEQLRESVV